MHIDIIIKIPTGIGPIVVLGTRIFNVALNTSGIQISLDLGFGIGVNFNIDPFSASASYTQNQTILVIEAVFSLGISTYIRAHVNLVIASTDLYFEAWVYASIKIIFYISFFLVYNIGMEEEAY